MKRKKDEKPARPKFQVDRSRFPKVQRLTSFRRSHPIFSKSLLNTEAVNNKFKEKMKKKKTEKKRVKIPKRPTLNGNDDIFKPKFSSRFLDNEIEKPKNVNLIANSGNRKQLLKKKKEIEKIQLQEEIDQFDGIDHPPLKLPFRKDAETANNISVFGDIENENQFLSEDEIYFFQLPYQFPLESSIKASKNDLKKKKKKRIGQIEKIENFWEKVYQNTLIDGNKNGKIGELIVYKSGKTKLKVGDTYFNIREGANIGYAEEIVKIDTSKKVCDILGNVQKRLICTPSLDTWEKKE